MINIKDFWSVHYEMQVENMSKSKQAAKSVTIIIIFTIASKFLGFIRETLIAAKFGSGTETDTFLLH